MTRLLLISTDQNLLRALSACQGDTTLTTSVEEAQAVLSEGRFDGLLYDLAAVGAEDLPTFLSPGLPVVVFTDAQGLSAAVQAVKDGAADLLLKPCEPAALAETCRRIFPTPAASRAEGAKTAAVKKGALSRILGSGPQMGRVFETIESAAGFPTTVLIVGETGTGKELVARAIHELSPRRERPLVSINCAAIPETLLEDELFGHIKGAFTGAHQARLGRFEQADGGTLFLDEIGEMGLNLQAKLLRVLQEREFERLGSGRTIKVDVRVIAATSADLEERMRRGEFRKDLFYRLNVVPIKLPPLRERRADLPLLATHFLARFSAEYGVTAKTLSALVLERLAAYDWPGNIRELQNVIERATILSGARSQVLPCDLPEEITRLEPVRALHPPSIPDHGLHFDSVVSQIERELLLESLRRTGGNKCQAARLLNLKRTTFIEKLKRLNLTPEAEPLLI